jgi:hypothetical protein
MSFAAQFPNIQQWVSNHGSMSVSSVDESTVEVALSDAGGVPENGKFYGTTVDEALAKANEALPEWMLQTKMLLDQLSSGRIRQTESEYLRVAGWPARRNPFYSRP